jgi:hypothetical protein
MNPGAVEETGKVATAAIEGLKTSPLSLALVVMNIIFVLFVSWISYAINERTITQFMVKDTLIESMVGSIGDGIAALRNTVIDNTNKVSQLAANTTQLNDSLNRISRIQDEHERRIRDLEGKR